MTSQFAAECLLLTSQLPDYLMGRRKLAVPIAQRARYVVGAADAPAAEGLSREGTTKELREWVRRHLVSYEPCGERWRISLDEEEACVVVANPRITLNGPAAAVDPGAGGAADAASTPNAAGAPMDILVSCVWTGHAGAAQLQHVHISGIGLATRVSNPNGLVAPDVLDAALPADSAAPVAEGGLALDGLPVLQNASVSAPPRSILWTCNWFCGVRRTSCTPCSWTSFCTSPRSATTRAWLARRRPFACAAPSRG